MKCTHNDCFSCPYDDCICETSPGRSSKKRQQLSPAEKKARKAQANAKYYAKNQSRYQQLHRDYYRKKKGSCT